MSHKSQVIDYLKSVLYWKNEWTIPLILYGANVCKLHSTNKKIHMFPYIIWSYMIHQEKKKKANKKIKKFLFLQLMVGYEIAIVTIPKYDNATVDTWLLM